MVQEFDLELVNNQEQRLPCVLVLDTSYSMNGEPINELLSGLELLAHNLKDDDQAAQKVQLLIVKCGGDAEVISDWTDAENFTPPYLVADGGTPLGEAVALAARELEDRKSQYKSAGISYLKPWLFIISDGAPTDDWRSKAADLVSQEKAGKFTTFLIAVEGADISIMEQFGLRGAKKLRGIEFKELFEWISASVRIGSAKINDTDKVSLPEVNWEEL